MFAKVRLRCFQICCCEKAALTSIKGIQYIRFSDAQNRSQHFSLITHTMHRCRLQSHWRYTMVIKGTLLSWVWSPYDYQCWLKFLYELEKTCCMDYDTCRRLDHFTWTYDPRFARDINGYICFCLVEIYNVRKRAKQRGVVWRHVTMVPKFLDNNNRERRQREWQKSITVWHEILRFFAVFPAIRKNKFLQIKFTPE